MSLLWRLFSASLKNSLLGVVFAVDPTDADFKLEQGSCFVGSQGVATLRCIPCLLENIVNFGLIMAGIVAVFFMVWSGVRFIASGGDPIKVASARKTLTFAGAGLVIILLSYSIINFAGKSFGIEIFQQCAR